MVEEIPLEAPEPAEVAEIAEEDPSATIEAPSPTVAPMPERKTRPQSNIFTLLLILSAIFVGVAIYLVGWELRNFYHVTFGFMSPIEKTSKSDDSDKGTTKSAETPAETPPAPAKTPE